MAIEIEQRIDELCDLAAGEHNQTKLKNVIEQLLECIDEATATRRAKRISLKAGGNQNE